jgi:TonB family protein
MRLLLLTCLLSLSAAHALTDDSRAQGCGDCKDSIQSLEKEIDELPQGDAMLPDLLFRLGELYREVAAFHRSAEGQENNNLRGLEQATYAKDAARHAEKQYMRIIKESPRSKRREEALSALVHLYLGNEQVTKAMEVCARLVKEYPKSSLLPATHLAIAEAYFERSKGEPDMQEKAREFYKKAAAVPDSPVQLFALYMRGWCSFRLDDLVDAQAAWKAAALAYRARALRKSNTPRDRVLFNEVLQNWVKVFARVGDARKARGEFNELSSDPDERIALLMMLDLLYRQHDSAKKREAGVTLAELHKHCTANRARACNALGLLYGEGVDMDADKSRAVKFFAKACRSGLASGCHNFCSQTEEEAGVFPLEGQTVALREKACGSPLGQTSQDEAKTPAFWAPLERVKRREPRVDSDISRLLNEPSDVSRLLREPDDWDSVRQLFLEKETRKVTPPEPSPASPPEPPPAPPVATSKDVIRSVIRSHSSEVRYCYESALLRRSTLAGKLTVKFGVNAQGSVDTAEVDKSTLGDPVMESCIVEHVKQWVFPKPKGGGYIKVTYPFIFIQSPPN